MTHGCIDGYSRRIIYLFCNYLLKGFVVWVFQVEFDRGGENVEIARFMLEHPLRGPGRAVLSPVVQYIIRE